MRFTLLFILLFVFPPAYAEENYVSIKLGETQAPNNDYEESTTSIFGLGQRYEYISLELAYINFEDFKVKSHSNSYIELKGGRFSINGHLDLGWPELLVGASAVYYDASAHHGSTKFSDKHDTTFGLSAGLWFPLKRKWGFTINAGVTKNILDQDLKHFTIGLQRAF
ncbi:hypothetical protein ACU6U9_06510 [Pseudomonas sp. HK3]